jgi:sec-independent protein translocase protein TatA
MQNPFLAWGLPSGPDLVVLLVIVLVLFGAKRLPELARGLGQSVNEFKKAKDEFDKELANPSKTETAAASKETGPESGDHQKNS